MLFGQTSAKKVITRARAQMILFCNPEDIWQVFTGVEVNKAGYFKGLMTELNLLNFKLQTL